MELARRIARRTQFNGPTTVTGLTPCHVWLGGASRRGHGQIADGAGGTPYVHRVVWEATHGRRLPLG